MGASSYLQSQWEAHLKHLFYPKKDGNVPGNPFLPFRSCFFIKGRPSLKRNFYLGFMSWFERKKIPEDFRNAAETQPKDFCGCQSGCDPVGGNRKWVASQSQMIQALPAGGRIKKGHQQNCQGHACFETSHGISSIICCELYDSGQMISPQMFFF